MISLAAKAAAGTESNRVKCESNLRQIGLAILLYQNENGGLAPRTVMDTTGLIGPGRAVRVRAAGTGF